MIYNMSHVIGPAHAKQAAVLIRVCIGVYGSLNAEVSFLENGRCGFGRRRMSQNLYVVLCSLFSFSAFFSSYLEVTRWGG